jgi:CheY-like chemotaxis protein
MTMDHNNNKIKPIANILVVDDEVDIATVITKGLEQNNFLVSSFTSPTAALENFRQHSKDYCLVLSDVRMPRMSGFEFVRKARQLNPDVKTVLMTAFEINKSEFSKVMPSTTEVDDFVRKPVSIKFLKDVILRHIGNTKRLLD